MSKSRRQLKGWQFEVNEAKVAVPSSRARRVAKDEIILRRDEDGLELREGDTIAIQEEEDVQYALITSLQFAIEVFLDMQVVWFVKSDDVDESVPKNQIDEQELFLSSEAESVLVRDVIDKIIVLSEKEYAGIVSDDSNKNSTFFCKRALAIDGSTVSQPFDYESLYNEVKPNYEEIIPAVDRLFNKDATKVDQHTESTTPKAERGLRTPKAAQSSPTKANARKRVQYIDEEHDEEHDEEYDVLSNTAEDENIGDDESEEFTETEVEPLKPEPVKRKRGRPRLPDSLRKSPRKSKKNDASNSESPFEAESSPAKSSPRKKNSEVATAYSKRKHVKKAQLMQSFEFMNSLLDDKNSLKINDLARPSLKDLSPKKPKLPALQAYVRSGAFKEVKEKLHLSLRLSSLPCREDEFTTLFMNLDSAIREEIGCCLYVSGTPGVGKTATIREVISQLQEMRASNDINDFDFVEINGLKLITPTAAYERLWEKISGFELAPSNAAMLLETYFKKEEIVKKPLVVLLDELDQIATKRQNVMYNFLNWPTYAGSKLIVIAVANTMDLPERILTNKISSRLGLRRIQFAGYTFQQLGSIIEHRLDMITRQSRNRVEIGSDAIGFASRKVASVSGDARRALTICKRAVEIAEEDYQSKEDDDTDKVCQVQIVHISRAINETINSPIVKYMSSLSFVSKLFLAALVVIIRRTARAEQPLGVVIDEMKQLMTMKTSGNVFTRDNSLLEVLYGPQKTPSIRPKDFRYIIYELSENGIVNQQYIKTERYRLVSLDVSEEEVLAALRKDNDFASMI